MIIAVTLLTFAAACSGGSTRDPGGGAGNPDASGGENAVEVAYDSVYASAHSGVESPLREVVRTADEWTAVWGSIAADRTPAPPAPEVDFERSMLVAVGLGVRPSGGYAVRVAGIEAGSGTLRVTVLELAPGAGCIATMALTAPVVVVRLDRDDAEVEFTETRRERACD